MTNKHKNHNKLCGVSHFDFKKAADIGWRRKKLRKKDVAENASNVAAALHERH